MDKFEKQFYGTIAIVVVLIAFSAIVLINSLSKAVHEVDNMGGLKALTERVWEGKPKGDSDGNIR